MAVFRAGWVTRRGPQHAPQQLLAGVLAGRDLGAAACAMAPEPDRRRKLRPKSLPPSSLTLGELEALARALLAVLLAFLHTGIASQEAVLAKSGTQFRIEEADGAG